MQGNRSKDTKPEIALRSELHRRGVRLRKHVAVVPGLRFRPDIVFPRKRIVVECRGCFWHRCPIDSAPPKSNTEYWLPKLERNVERDCRNAEIIKVAGWELVVVWATCDAIKRRAREPSCAAHWCHGFRGPDRAAGRWPQELDRVSHAGRRAG